MKCGLMLCAAVTDPMLWPCTPVLQVPGSARVSVMLVETGGEPGPAAWLRPLPIRDTVGTWCRWQGPRSLWAGSLCGAAGVEALGQLEKKNENPEKIHF